MKDFENGPNGNKEEKSKSIFYLFFSIFIKTFWIPEFTSMNQLLTKCAMISKNNVYINRRRKNRLIQLPLTTIPLLVTLLTVNFFILNSKTITGEISKNAKVVEVAVKQMDKNFYKRIKFSKTFLEHLATMSIILVVNHGLFFAIGRFLVSINPVIKDTEHVKKIFVARGWSTEDSKHFLKTRGGLLCEIHKVSPDVILKDKEFWRDIKTTPKPDYFEFEYNNHVILFESGIVLQKIEYKF